MKQSTSLERETVEPNTSPTPEDLNPEVPEQETDPATIQQTSLPKVIFGQVSDPLYPPHPGQPESSDEELLRAAMEDPAVDAPGDSRPTPWRIVILITVAIVALGMVFLWRK